ncbi:MAG: hypothetical protein AB7Q17_05635 [Phycisphaerae bacterium]
MRTRLIVGLIPALLLAASRGVAAPPTLERVVARVADDSPLVVVVPSIDRLLEGLRAFGGAIGVDDLAKLDRAELLRDNFKLDTTAGIDQSGPLVMYGHPDDDGPVVLATLSDAGLWKRERAAEELADGVLKVSLGRDERYASIEDDILVLAPTEAHVRAALKANGKTGARVLKSCGEPLKKASAAFYADTEILRDTIGAGLAMGETFANMGVTAGGADPEMVTAMLRWGFEQLRRALDQSRVFTLVGRVSADGVHFATALRFATDSDVVRYLRTVKPPGAGPLAHPLPADWAMLSGYDWMTDGSVPGLTDALLKMLAAELGAKGQTNPEQLEKSLALAAEFNRKLTRVDQVLWATDEGKTASAMRCGGKHVRDIIHGFESYAELNQFMMRAWGLGGALTRTAGVERVGDVDARFSKTDFSTAAPEVARMMQSMYGPELVVYCAPLGDDALMVTGGATVAKAELERFLKAGRKPAEPAAALKSLFAELSPKPSAWMACNLRRMMDWLGGLTTAMGTPALFPKLPKDRDVFAASAFYLDPDGVRVEVVVPSAAIKPLVEQATDETSAGGDNM